VIIGLAVVAAVLLLELVARLVDLRLPQHLHWHDPLTTGKWHQLRRLRRQDPVDVVLAGSSQMLMSVDPLAFPTRCYNAALYRGVPTVMTQWLRDVALPSSRPRLVVWGLSILDLNDAGQFHLDVTSRFDAAPARRTGLHRLLPWLRLHVAMARRASLLVQPMRLARTLRHPDPKAKPLSALLGPMGRGDEYAHFDTYRLSDRVRDFIDEMIVPGLTMGGAQIDALRAGADAVLRSGASLVLIEMPCGQEFLDRYPKPAENVAEARELLARTATALGVPWVPLDYSDLPLDWFADPIHLNRTGMTGFTAFVVRTLAERGLLPAAEAAGVVAHVG
jgi:hypothetical protein